MDIGAQILERAQAHYAGLERQRIEVPEWGDGKTPAVITFTKLNISERRKIYRAEANGQLPDGMTVAVRAVMLKACDEAGKRLWSDIEEHAFMYKVDADVVAQIAASILAGVDLLSADEVDAEKNV